MKSPLRDGYLIIKEGTATLKKNFEAVGGKLYLTEQHLTFESHKFNIQSGVTTIELSDIQYAKINLYKFLRLIPLLPNSLSVYTTDETEYRFVLWGGSAWAKAINQHKRG